MGISPEAMQLLVDYPWPGNVRELRNLVESMVVLAHGREIGPNDIPPQIRQGMARLLPVPIGQVMRGHVGAEGRELEFILRSLVELKLQVEELRRRLDEASHGAPSQWIGEGRPSPQLAGYVGGLEPPAPPAENVVTLRAGMTMADIERAAIEAALRETRGNRRKAAEVLQIGERTLYRKLREYQVSVEDFGPGE
jgi:DNA-binding NtrC family response regulator